MTAHRTRSVFERYIIVSDGYLREAAKLRAGSGGRAAAPLAVRGVDRRIPHDLRRSAVRNLERAGVPRSTAMAMVGHKTEAIYRRYAITDETILREGAVKLAALHALTKAAERKVVKRATERK